MFPQTSWTVVVKAGKGHANELESFCRLYRQPVYAFARAKGLTHEDAEDLTQIFFASLLKRNLLQTADPAIGRLRNYLLRHFSFVLRDFFKHRNALSRGGEIEFVPINTAFGDVPAQASEQLCPLTEDILKEAFATLQEAYESSKPTIPFKEIKPFLHALDACERSSYDTILSKYPGISPEALRKRVSRLRGDLKKLLIARVPELARHSIKPRRDAQARFDRIASQGDMQPETVFNREWATCVLENARRLLKREFNQEFGDLSFRAFEPVLRGEEPDYGAIRSEYPSLTPFELQKRAEFIRERFVQIRTAIVGSTLADESEVIHEIRELDECWEA